ncbi:MAG: type II secretion system F family protein, partial [Pygmaiobacter sp.]
MFNKSEQKQLANREISVFCTQVAMLLHAGLPIPEGIRIMLEDSEDSEGRKILEVVLAPCERGELFSDALAASDVFPRYLIDMVRIGEVTGRLDEVLTALGAYYEREEIIGKNIRSAVRYPAIMIVMMLLVVGVLV